MIWQSNIVLKNKKNCSLSSLNIILENGMTFLKISKRIKINPNSDQQKLN